MGNAPDKIYIPIHQSYPNAPIDENNTHLGADWYTSKCDYSAVGFHEYIRKDAILDLLNGIYTNSRYEQFVIGCVIEKINSL